MEIEMKIKGLVVDPISKMPIVVLEDIHNERMLPIWIGVFEANAIALKIENIATPRPMTHDLLKNLLDELDIKVEKIVVNDVKDNTFYAMIYCRHMNRVITIDSRPSDAIALATRAGSPVFASKELLDEAGVEIHDDTEEEEIERFREFLDDVTAEDFFEQGPSS